MSAVIEKDITFEQFVKSWENTSSKFAVKLFEARLKIAKMYEEEFKKSFETKRSPRGDIWPLRVHEEKYKHPLMVETGDLKNSITYALIEGGDIVIFTNEAAFVNSNRRTHGSMSYAAFHNVPIGRNVARRFMEDVPDLELRVKEILEKVFVFIP